MTSLRDKTDAELLILHRDVAVAIANYVSSDEIMEQHDLTNPQLRRIQTSPAFQQALLEAQSKKEDAALAAGIITQDMILRESAASLKSLTTIRDLHTPGVEIPDIIPEHERPAKKDHWLAARVDQDLLSRAGFGQVNRSETVTTIRIDRETAGRLVSVLQESPKERAIIDITRADIASGDHNSKILSLTIVKEESDAAEGA